MAIAHRCRRKIKPAATPARNGGQRRKHATVRAVTAAVAPLADEPTPEQIAAEQTRLDEATQAQRSKGRRSPTAGEDILATYMDLLSQIPLFTPEQELANARHLETLELAAWRTILLHPRGVSATAAEVTDLAAGLRNDLQKLIKSYERSAQRGRQPRSAPARERRIEALARALRSADSDKHRMDGVVRRLRRDAWSRRAYGDKAVFRFGHADLAPIERGRGTLNRARNNFVRANLRLVVSVARNFHHYRIPFLDLIQEGNVGLMKAVHRFDHRRGFRFSTYAHWWIRQSIERAIINKGSQVRLPVHVIDARRQLSRAKKQLTQDLGRSPSHRELARATRLSVSKVEEILGGVQQDPISLDERVGDDDPRRLVDMVRDHEAPILDETVIRENTHARVRELMQKLNPIEKDIIRRRFGLDDDSDQTLDEIGRLYNLSRERVRQIQAQGLMKMRRMCERREITAV